MYYEICGSNIDRKMLFLHGFPLGGESWKHQREMDASLATYVTPDLPGFGKSDNIADALSIDLMVDRLFSLLDSLSWKKCVWVGLSMGGYIALRAYEREPERFHGLVLSDTKSQADTDEGRLARSESIRSLRKDGLEAFGKAFLEKTLHPEAGAEVRGELMRIIMANKPAGLERALIAMAARTDTSQALKKSDVPVSCIVGSHDKVTPPDVVKALADDAPKGAFHAIDGAGHFPANERPEAFNAVMADFIRRLLP